MGPRVVGRARGLPRALCPGVRLPITLYRCSGGHELRPPLHVVPRRPHGVGGQSDRPFRTSAPFPGTTAITSASGRERERGREREKEREREREGGREGGRRKGGREGGTEPETVGTLHHKRA